MHESHCLNQPLIFGSDGKAIKGYYQWDVNQWITIQNVPAGTVFECHFAKQQCHFAYAVTPVPDNGNYLVYIPNELFKTPGDISLYLYIDTPGDGQRTKYEYDIPIIYRPKPEGYIEPTPEERITMRKILLKAEGWAIGTHDGIPVGEEDPAYENNAKYYAEKAREFAEKPYLSLERVSRYLYNVSFANAPQDIETDYVPVGGCSSYVQNGRLYRNLDWNYDRTATFHVTLPGIEGLAFMAGLTDTELDDELIAQLPYRMVDGANEHGIMISTHVLYNDWDAHGHGTIPLTRLPYIVLSRVKSMETIETDLADVLDNLITTSALDAMEYLIQVLVTDGTTTYVLRPENASDGTYEAVDITDNPKLSNFRWVPDTTVVRTDLQRRPTGVERWNLMPCPLEELRFTKAYEQPTRLSEFIGLRETTKDSTDEELMDIYGIAHAMYEDRERDGTLWQTMHSAVYSSKGLEHLWIQEDWGKDYIASSGGDVSGDKTYVHRQMQASDTWTVEHNLGKYPSVTVVDSGGSVVIGETIYLNENRVRLSFMSPFGGTAYLN